MIGTVRIQVKPEEIIEAIKGMEKRKRETILALLGLEWVERVALK